MKWAVLAGAVCLAACATQSGGSGAAAISDANLMRHIERLASDEFEGRAPGTNGEQLTINYIAEQFAAAGLSPGGPNGSWFQPAPIATLEAVGEPALRIGDRSYRYQEDMMLWTTRQNAPHIDLRNAELVFVGYGIVSPENNWNDYVGLDMRGKIAVILVNDPDFDTGDDRGFSGRAMTYYGRWTYKYEEAARQGAAGALIVHEDAAAAYGWDVVSTSWSGQQLDMVRTDGGASRVQVEGWLQQSVAREVFAAAGMDLAAERARAQTPGFTPRAMGLRASAVVDTRVSQQVTNNVIGVLPGRTRPQEAVVYGAHWDHLGRCQAVDGDDICNGARDNASGVAGLIELARVFAANGAAERSVAFIALTAEESGSLGSRFYAANPTFEPRNMAAMINMDVLGTYGRTREMRVVGYGQSELDQMLTEAAARQGREVRPELYPERGAYFRSDQLNFARVGVPALYANMGFDFLEGGEELGRRLASDYEANRYHSPNDEVLPEFDLSGAAQDLENLYAVGRRVAEASTWPQWNENSEFRNLRRSQGR